MTRMTAEHVTHSVLEVNREKDADINVGRVDEERQVLDTRELNAEGERRRVDGLEVDMLPVSVYLIVIANSGDGVMERTDRRDTGGGGSAWVEKSPS